MIMCHPYGPEKNSTENSKFKVKGSAQDKESSFYGYVFLENKDAKTWQDLCTEHSSEICKQETKN
jgi:hypothetical protein